MAVERMTGGAFIRVQQPYGPAAPTVGTTTPRTAAGKFGTAVADLASYTVPTPIAAGKPFGLSAHFILTAAAPAGNVGVVAAGTSRIELAAGKVRGVISGGASTLYVPGPAGGGVGVAQFVAMSYDGTRVKLWHLAGLALTEVTIPVPFTPDAITALHLAHGGDSVLLPGTVEQAGLHAASLDEGTVQQLILRPLDVDGGMLLAAAAVGLTGAGAHTTGGTGRTRLLPAIPATITAGAQAGDPGGTTHRIAVPNVSGVVVGNVLTTSWGIAVRVLGVTVGTGGADDLLTCIRM